MRKGFVYYRDPRDTTFVKPKQGQFYLSLDQNGLIEVRGDSGQAITQTQFVGTGATTPGDYLPLAGGTVTGPVLFKGNVTFTNPVEFSSTISSGGTDLSVILSAIAAGSGGGGVSGGPFLAVSGGTGGPYTFTGNTNFTGIIQSGGTDLSTLFSSFVPLAGNATIAGTKNFTGIIQSGGTDLSTLLGGAGGGAVATYTNGVNNRLITSTAADGINGESNLTFDGNVLTVGQNTAADDGSITIQGGDLDSINTFGTTQGDNNLTLYFDTGGDGADFIIKHSDNDWTSAFFHNGGAVDLYHQGSVRFQTAASGGTLLNTWNIGQILSGGTDLSTLFGGGGGGAVATYTNGVNNRVITSTAADGINGESNLTFNGSTLTVTGNMNATNQILSGGTDLSAAFGGLKEIVWNAGNYATLDEATDYPIYLKPSAGAVVTTGDLYQMQSSGGWNLADASASGTSIGLIGIPLSTNSKDGMLMQGVIALDTSDFSGTASQGATIYMSETAGNYTFDPPSTTGSVVRALGYYVESKTIGRSTAYIIYFNPSPDFFIVA